MFYWLVHHVELKDFAGYQKMLAKRFGCDPSINDLPRVLRLPGFVHRKAEPFLTHIERLDKFPPYKIADLFPSDRKADLLKKAGDAFQDFAYANDDTPWGKLNSEALANLDLLVPMIFPAATRRGAENGWRVSSQALGRDFEEDLSFHPTGITDWGPTGVDK